MASSEIVRTDDFESLNFSRNVFTSPEHRFCARAAAAAYLHDIQAEVESWRKVPPRTAASKSRLVAAITRARMATRSGRAHRLDLALLQSAPTAWPANPQADRRFVKKQRAVAGGFEQPLLRVLGTGEEPFTWPNSSDSISRGHQREQSTGTNGRARRGPEK